MLLAAGECANGNAIVAGEHIADSAKQDAIQAQGYRDVYNQVLLDRALLLRVLREGVPTRPQGRV